MLFNTSWKRALLSLLPVVLLSGVAGFCGFLALSYHFAYDSLHAQVFTIARTQASTGNYTFRYGTVGAVDPTNHLLTVSLKNMFSSAEPPTTLTLKVPDTTLITRQVLTETNGVYTGIVNDGPRQLGDITAGDRIAFMMETDDTDGSRMATVILFGNPL